MKPKHWTWLLAANEAAKFKTKKTFESGSPDAYRYAVQEGILKAITTHMSRREPSTWTHDLVKKEALQYVSEADFKSAKPDAFNYAVDHDLLDIIFHHTPQFGVHSVWQKFRP